MSKKVSKEVKSNNTEVENSENVIPTDDFDLSVLKTDIQEAEKEAKEQYNQALIEKANIQQKAEILPEGTENFENSFKELLAFVFSFVNKQLEKVSVSKFDKEFIDDFVKRLFELVPKPQLHKIQKILGAGNQAKAGIRLMKVFKFITFIAMEFYKRYDEYSEFKKVEKLKKH